MNEESYDYCDESSLLCNQINDLQYRLDNHMEWCDQCAKASARFDTVLEGWKNTSET